MFLTLFGPSVNFNIQNFTHVFKYNRQFLNASFTTYKFGYIYNIISVYNIIQIYYIYYIIIYIIFKLSILGVRFFFESLFLFDNTSLQ